MASRNLPSGYYELHRGALYRYNRKVFEVVSLTKTQSGGTAIVKESNEQNKRTIPIVLTSLIKTNEQYKKEIELTHGNQITLTYGIIEIMRQITGYYKGTINKPELEMDPIKGEDIPDWSNFVWTSKHSAIGLNLSHCFTTVADYERAIHTVIHVLSTAAKIVTKAGPGDIDVIDVNGTIYLYDNSSDGANGYSQIIYDEIDKVLQVSKNLLSDCTCHVGKDEGWGGCQKCTFTTSYCQTKNKELSKLDAMKFFGL